MDKWGSFLLDRRTDQSLATEIKPVFPNDLQIIGWNFDFSESQKNGYNIYALRLKGDQEIQGLISFKFDRMNKAMEVDIIESAPHNVGRRGKYIGVGPHLFAFVGKISIESGYDVIYFKAKTDLIEYYKHRLGAQQIGTSQRMILEGDALYDLVNDFYSASNKDE